MNLSPLLRRYLCRFVEHTQSSSVIGRHLVLRLLGTTLKIAEVWLSSNLGLILVEDDLVLRVWTPKESGP